MVLLDNELERTNSPQIKKKDLVETMTSSRLNAG